MFSRDRQKKFKNWHPFIPPCLSEDFWGVSYDDVISINVCEKTDENTGSTVSSRSDILETTVEPLSQSPYEHQQYRSTQMWLENNSPSFISADN